MATPQDAPVIGVDLGIANFLTTSDGKQYGTFTGKLVERHQWDREKRRRKAELRACLKQNGVPKEQLPSTRNKKLVRTVRQEINRAVNHLYADHPDAQIAHEQLQVAGMKLKARRMNAYLYASTLAHIPKQLAWGADKRDVRAHSHERLQFPGMPSLSSCGPQTTQQNVCCVVCGYTTHAHVNVAENLASRWFDQELAACADRKAIKALLAQRHQQWNAVNETSHGWP